MVLAFVLLILYIFLCKLDSFNLQINDLPLLFIMIFSDLEHPIWYITNKEDKIAIGVVIKRFAHPSGIRL